MPVDCLSVQVYLELRSPRQLLSVFKTGNSKALQECRFTEYMMFWLGYTIKLLPFLGSSVTACGSALC